MANLIDLGGGEAGFHAWIIIQKHVERI
jgi:hypothetical protein